MIYNWSKAMTHRQDKKLLARIKRIRGAMQAERLDEPVARTRYREAAADRHAPAVRNRRHGETRSSAAQRPAGLGHDEGREMSLEGVLAGLAHSGGAGKGRDCNLMPPHCPLRETTRASAPNL